MAQIIDGKAEAARVRAEVGRRVSERAAAGLRPPGLVTILVGDDAASQVYVGSKQSEAKALGFFSEQLTLPATVTQAKLETCIRESVARGDVDGILVQLPLPAALDADRALLAIDPDKDVDGLHPYNQGALLRGMPGLRPCTPLGCMRLLDTTAVDPRGRHAVVIGRSSLVGKPVALMLLERDATVVMCHSRTADLAAQVAAADIVVAAAGSPGLVRGAWIKPGAVVIDVGMNRSSGSRQLTGDVEFGAAAERAAYITPVPGGVGPMTVAMLMRNTLDACETRENPERDPTRREASGR